MRRRVLLVTAFAALPLSLLAANRLRPAILASATAATGSGERVGEVARRSATLPDLGAMPELSGGTRWINSAPLTRAALQGKVAMIEVWTYGCYNCLNALPHIKETAARYKAEGLVTIGVHTPEFDREKVPANVERRVKELGVEFPVVMDNDFAIWRAFNNRFWPSVYIIDKKGRIRFHHDGEGKYAEIDAAVRELLAE